MLCQRIVRKLDDVQKVLETLRELEKKKKKQQKRKRMAKEGEKRTTTPETGNDAVGNGPVKEESCGQADPGVVMGATAGNDEEDEGEKGDLEFANVNAQAGREIAELKILRGQWSAGRSEC